MDEEALKILKIFELDAYADTNCLQPSLRKTEKAGDCPGTGDRARSCLLLDEPAAGMNPNETAGSDGDHSSSSGIRV